MNILQIDNLTFRYPETEIPALDGVSFTVRAGEFVVIAGESGCGKTTLIKLLKRELAPHGEKSGLILYNGVETRALDERTAACDIGYVLQNPENQVVTDKVWHELAFGLESLGLPTPVIRRRVAEMASYFGIEDWFRKNTAELSGGQKQMLSLASVMAMQPKVLILDEPTSQLDPIAAADFIGTLQKLNRELGLTILLVEHRLEEVFPIADRVMLMEKGKILLYCPPREVGVRLRELRGDHRMLAGLPSATRIYDMLEQTGPCPLTVKEGRQFLEEHYGNAVDSLELPPYTHRQAAAVELRDVWFRYERDLPDVLRGISLSVYEGEIFCLLGGNGTGKTTALSVIAGLRRPYRGKVLVGDRRIGEYKGYSLYRRNIALLPQNPQTVFLKKTVREDLEEIGRVMAFDRSEQETLTVGISEKLGIAHLLDKHPYDLSGGEQQKAALAKMLLLHPRILLLDEPTKGIDAYAKQTLSTILRGLKAEGITILMVTHDVEFAAENADRCALFFDGDIACVDTPNAFFSGNSFYTTAANRLSRGLYKNAVSCEDVAALCRLNEPVGDGKRREAAYG